MKILSAGIDEINFDINADSFNGHMVFLNKPSNALWGSTYTPQEHYKSDWLLWCTNEGFELDRYNHGVIYNLHKNARILDITSIEDYENKIVDGNYLMEDTTTAILSSGKKLLIIDWDAVARDYDAFHITNNAVWEMRYGIHYDNGKEVYKDFYSWDVESWVIFHKDCINKGSITNISLKNIIRD